MASSGGGTGHQPQLSSKFAFFYVIVHFRSSRPIPRW
ncbi:hypothetical protein CCACVL1_04003 [Corchorus capsularis]|uniref:Uncharacterized protein n=1 Tax=Corchorus capsularis TaxID=210143 RepID=A0A1R3JVM4_COCAP|nr:hypothetical protein CCACVL1_04003 [Corchorus capsularis]